MKRQATKILLCSAAAIMVLAGGIAWAFPSEFSDVLRMLDDIKLGLGNSDDFTIKYDSVSLDLEVEDADSNIMISVQDEGSVGGLTVTGTFTAGALAVTGDVAITTGDVIIDNAKAYKIKDNAGTARNAVTVDTGDDLTIGSTSYDDVHIDVGSRANAVIIAQTTGNMTLAGTLAVNGDTITSDGATLTINAGGTVAIQDNVTITGTLAVNGDTITSDGATLTINAGGTVAIQDAITGTSTLDIEGDIDIGSGTDITADAGLTLSPTGDLHLNPTGGDIQFTGEFGNVADPISDIYIEFLSTDTTVDDREGKGIVVQNLSTIIGTTARLELLTGPIASTAGFILVAEFTSITPNAGDLVFYIVTGGVPAEKMRLDRTGKVFFQGDIDMGPGNDLTSDGDLTITPGGGEVIFDTNVDFGVNDTLNTTVSLYGDSTTSGQFRLYNGGDSDDDNVDFWTLRGRTNSGAFEISPDSGQAAKFGIDDLTFDITIAEDLLVNGTSGSTYAGPLAINGAAMTSDDATFALLDITPTKIDFGGNAAVDIGKTGLATVVKGSLNVDETATFTDDLTVDTDTFFVDSSTNQVGVGTTSLQTLLHLAKATGGDGTAQELLRLQGDFSTTGSGVLIRFTNQNDSGLVPNTGEYNLAAITGYDFDGDWGGAIAFHTVPTGTTGGGALVRRMTIDPAGQVGIGTPFPTQVLDVGGNIILSGDVILVDGAKIRADGGDPQIEFDDTNNWLEITGDVGIGTSPTVELDVAGDGAFSGDLTVSGAEIFPPATITTDVTPTAAGRRVIIIGTWIASNDITDFPNETAGQFLTILGGNANCNVVDGAPIQLEGDTTWNGVSGATLQLLSDGTIWYELTRSAT